MVDVEGPPPQRLLPLDPNEIIQINAACREDPRGAADDLWTADELALQPARDLPFCVPTLTPDAWPSTESLPTQDQYTDRFRQINPIGLAILRRLNSHSAHPIIVVAGGCASAPYWDHDLRRDTNNADYFIVGLEPSDEAQLWARVHAFKEAFLEEVQMAEAFWIISNPPSTTTTTHLYEVFAPGLATLTYAASDRPYIISHRLALQAYPSPAAVVHSFDLGPCCTFFDGRTARSSTMGAFSQAFRACLVYPPFRNSMAYEVRLLKYFLRRYSALFMGMPEGPLPPPPKKIQFSRLVVCPTRASGNRMWGTFARIRAGFSDPTLPLSALTSHSARGCWPDPKDADSAYGLLNLAQLNSFEGMFVSFRQESLVDGRLSSEGPNRWLEAHDPPRAPTLSEVYPLNRHEGAVSWATVTVHLASSHCRLDVVGLMKYFGLSPAGVARFSAEVRDWFGKFRQHLSILEALERFQKEVVEPRYLAAAASPQSPCRWVGRFTTARHPRAESPAAWYWPFRPKADPVEVAQEEVFCCILCRGPLHLDEPNFMFSPCCGEAIHRDCRSGCFGFFYYMKTQGICPRCNVGFDQESRCGPDLSCPIYWRPVVDVWLPDDDEEGGAGGP